MNKKKYLKYKKKYVKLKSIGGRGSHPDTKLLYDKYIKEFEERHNRLEKERLKNKNLLSNSEEIERLRTRIKKKEQTKKDNIRKIYFSENQSYKDKTNIYERVSNDMRCKLTNDRRKWYNLPCHPYTETMDFDETNNRCCRLKQNMNGVYYNPLFDYENNRLTSRNE